MPFFIPIILIGAGVAAGGSGAALGGVGLHDMASARRRMKDATSAYDEQRSSLEARQSETNARLRDLRLQQEDALNAVVRRMAEFLRRHEKEVRSAERLLVDRLDLELVEVGDGARLQVDSAAIVRGLIGSTAVGTGTAAGVTSAAGSLGVASTGAAISGLSGAAAESATLAFLGGGSVAAGGGGMALGAATLNFVTIGPAVFVGGLVLKGQGQKALTQARQVEAAVAVASAEMERSAADLDVVDLRARELVDVLVGLTAKAVAALDELESKPFDPGADAETYRRAMTLTIAVRDVALAQVIDSEGGLDDAVVKMTIRYSPMAEEADDE